MKADMALPAIDSPLRYMIAVSLITVIGFILRVFLLPAQPVSVDDFDVAISSIHYMESGQLGPTMWNHPNLRGILVYGALRLFGTGVVGIKGLNLLLGTGCIPLVAAVTRRIFRSNRIALLAAFLFALDSLAIDFSRQGINDIYLAFFPLAGIYLAYRFCDSGNITWLAGSGILFGCGLASKWSGLFPLFATICLLIWQIRQCADHDKGRSYYRLSQVFALLIVLPLMVYILTFIPWFGRGYSLSEWLSLQHSMYSETSQHTGYRPKTWDVGENRAYKWFIVPTVYIDNYLNLKTDIAGNVASTNFDDNHTILFLVTNPFVWLLVIPACVYVGRRAIRDRDEGAFFLAGLFLFSYLPLAVSHRPIWLNTALTVFPYAVMAVAGFVWSLAERFRKQQAVIASYVIIVTLVSFPLYLLSIGQATKMPMVREYVKRNYLKLNEEPIMDSADELTRSKEPRRLQH